ncbi:MAG TPA: hypothetical protein VLA09_13220 [Longimicrobiales bacterium]|nr:hypothetical protein [Longimicrobiales bacterium]
MIFLGIVLVLGLWTRQPTRFWYHAAAAVAIHYVAGTLFGLGQDTDGPPLSGLAGLTSLALVWALPAWLVFRGYGRRTRRGPQG